MDERTERPELRQAEGRQKTDRQAEGQAMRWTERRGWAWSDSQAGRKKENGQTDRHTDVRTVSQPVSQTDRQTDRQTGGVGNGPCKRVL